MADQYQPGACSLTFPQFCLCVHAPPQYLGKQETGQMAFLMDSLAGATCVMVLWLFQIFFSLSFFLSSFFFELHPGDQGSQFHSGQVTLCVADDFLAPLS